MQNPEAEIRAMKKLILRNWFIDRDSSRIYCKLFKIIRGSRIIINNKPIIEG